MIADTVPIDALEHENLRRLADQEAARVGDGDSAEGTPGDEHPRVGGIEIRHGSHVELGDALSSRLETRFGLAAVFDDGAIHGYGEPTAGVWAPVPGGELETAVHGFDGLRVQSPGGKAQALVLKQTDIRGTIACAKARLDRPGFFVAATPGIAFANGFVVVEPEGARLLAHSPSHRARVAAPFPYAPEAPRSLFEAFMAGVFRDDEDAREKIALLQEHAGACLVGIATRYQQAIVLTGPGENGKSKYVDVIASLFPANAVTAIAIQDLGQEYRRALLAGVRLNAVSELPSRDVIDSDAFKAIISGDSIVGRHIREAPFTFRPIAGHLFSANELPGTADQTPAFWRRLVPVTFNRSFATDPERDPEIADKIIRLERPTIAAWAIDGAVRLMRRGHYLIPRSSQEAKQSWRHNADQVRLFAEDCVVEDVEAQTQLGDAYRSYQRWCAENGHHPMNSHKFGERLARVGFTKDRTAARRFWCFRLRALRFQADYRGAGS